MGLLLKDGSIDFLEREDGQIKIRGQRLELGEIEAALISHPLVKSACVISSHINSKVTHLIAFIQSHETSRNTDRDVNIHSINDYLKEILPEHMLPYHIEIVQHFPLTGNGKINKEKLLELYFISLQKIEILPSQRIIYLHQGIFQSLGVYNIFFAFKTPFVFEKSKLYDTLLFLLSAFPELNLKVNKNQNDSFLLTANYREPDQIFDIESINQVDDLDVIEKFNMVSRRYIDLENTPYFKIKILNAKHHSYILFVIHHFFADGSSIGNLISAFFEYYKDGRSAVGHPFALLSKVSNTVKAFTTDPLYERQKAYWFEKFYQVSDLSINTWHGQKFIAMTGQGEQLIYLIEEELHQKLLSFAMQNEVSVFILLFAIFVFHLYSVTNQEELVIATIVNTREPDFEEILFPLINTVLAKFSLNKTMNFLDVIQMAADEVYDLIENAKFPYEKLIELLRDQSLSLSQTNRSVDVCFSKQEVDFSRLKNDYGLKELHLHNHTAKFPLSVAMVESINNINLLWEFSTEHFNKEIIDSHVKAFDLLLRRVLASPLLLAKNCREIYDSVLIKKTNIKSTENITTIALKHPDKNSIKHSKLENENLKKLENIWKSVLNLDHVDINKGFFELGGDSLLAVEICSRAARLGIGLRPNDIIKNQTLRFVTSATSELGRKPTIYNSKEAFPLSPIQIWAIKNFENIDELDQQVAISLRKYIDLKRLDEILKLIFQNHPLFNQIFTIKTTGSYVRLQEQNIATPKISEDFFDKKISLKGGALFGYKFQKSNSALMLFIKIHHYLIDGYSWQVLLTDIFDLYENKISKSEMLSKWKYDFSKYLGWLRFLNDPETLLRVQKEAFYWQTILKCNSLIPTDSTSAATSEQTIEFTVFLTHKINLSNFLLAVNYAVKETWHIESLRVDLEGHGRDSIVEELDIFNCIGWFSAIYPFILVSGRGHTQNVPEYIRSQLESIPNKGELYILSLLSKNFVNQIASPDSSCLRLNYLGRIFHLSANAVESIKLFSSTNRLGKYLIDITAYVSDNQLHVSLTYAQKKFQKKTIIKFIDYFKKYWDEHALNQEKLVQTGPFPMIPLQKAYWYGRYNYYAYSVVSPYVYLEFQGDKLDFAKLQIAWQKLALRHDALRLAPGNDGGQIIKKYDADEHAINFLACKSIEQFNEIFTNEKLRILQNANQKLYELSYLESPRDSMFLARFDLACVDHLSLRILFHEFEALYFNINSSLKFLHSDFEVYAKVLSRNLQRIQGDNSDKLPNWFTRSLITPALPGLTKNNNETKENKMQRISFDLNKIETITLQKTAQAANVSVSSLFGSLFAFFLHKESKQTNFILNIMFFGRENIDTSSYDIVGPCAANFLLPLEIDTQAVLRDYLSLTQEHILEIISNPILKNFMGLKRNSDRRYDLPVAPFVFSSSMDIKHDTPSLFKVDFPGRLVNTALQTPHVLIDFQLYFNNGTISLTWDYLTPYIQEKYAAELFEEFKKIIASINPETLDRKLSELHYNSDEKPTLSAKTYTPIILKTQSKPKDISEFNRVRSAISQVLTEISHTHSNSDHLIQEGLESFQAVEFVIKLEKVFNLQVPLSILGEANSIDDIVFYICSNL